MPSDTLLQLPDDRNTVLRKAVIVIARNFGCKDRNKISVCIPSGQRLIKNATSFLVLDPHRKMRIEQGRRLPKKQFERASTASLGWLVGNSWIGERDPRLAQHQTGHWCGES